MASIREQIALKRAEAAKRAQQQKQQPHSPIAVDGVELALDSRPVDDVIRRGQQTGQVNLTARQLTAVPVYLFECHLGIIPDSMQAEAAARSSSAKSNGTPLYHARDLTILKLANNEIPSIPPEISLFGAITVLDLHGNLLEALPNAICDLTDLVNLDISQNRLRSLPHALVNLPVLAILNLAHNEIADLGWTAAKPLPRLHTLNLSHNPLGPPPRKPNQRPTRTVDEQTNQSANIWDIVNRLPLLRELRMRACNLDPSPVVSSQDRSRFLPSLTLLDVEENPLEFAGVQTLLGEGRIAAFEGEPNRVNVLAAGRIVKEKWELEAERRVRRVGSRPSMRAEDIEPATPPPMPAELAALAKAADKLAISDPPPPPYEASASGSTSLAKWHDAVHGALNLPQCLPARTRGPPTAKAEGPQQTLPVEVFYQAFSTNLKTLTLSNRRIDRSFVLPDALFAAVKAGNAAANTFLPRLEELSLDGCGLSDNLTLSSESGTSETGRVFVALGTLFPTVTTLDLSYNQLTSYDGLAPILRRGLKTLRVRGNQYQHVDVFVDLAQELRSGSLAATQLTELDVRENNIDKLPPILGALPLTGFFVDGNVFRVPQRRVWEREGTQGLLKWLKERIV
ncbi:hypothetical protein EXIGLDRAFT_834828 [Exidia glandulosa HHB12029]|uniref:L domain-like protein n=1 Tax=Exidia glandulosa HHB12029 TaxID=1314781 RepID=A0A165JEV8_EXIGL|nr:hypothetical protein EXIGLDRAFT_834828 [Exidia glandulosa HHB12029]